MWGFNNVERPCGRATELRREDDGTVTAELEFFDPLHPAIIDNLIINIYANPANGTTDENSSYYWRVSKARIRSVSVWPNLGNPGASLV